MAKGEFWDMSDSVLAGLRVHDASPARVERIRARCLEALEARRKKAQRPSLEIWKRWLEPAVAFSLSVVYLIAAVGSSLALLR